MVSADRRHQGVVDGIPSCLAAAGNRRRGARELIEAQLIEGP
jgi:hypothetical protein